MSLQMTLDCISPAVLNDLEGELRVTVMADVSSESDAKGVYS